MAETVQVAPATAITVHVLDVVIATLTGSAGACRHAQHAKAAAMLDDVAKQIRAWAGEMIREEQSRIVRPA